MRLFVLLLELMVLGRNRDRRGAFVVVVVVVGGGAGGVSPLDLVLMGTLPPPLNRDLDLWDAILSSEFCLACLLPCVWDGFAFVFANSN